MNNPIFEAHLKLEELSRQSIANSKGGSSNTIWGSGSLSREWGETYDRWMTLRARAGNKFALDLGYGG